MMARVAVDRDAEPDRQIAGLDVQTIAPLPSAKTMLPVPPMV